MAAEAVALAVAVVPLLVGVHLVGGHHHHRAGVPQRPQSFQHLKRTLHVGGPGAQRIGVTASHQRLGGKMQHHFGLAGGNRRRQGGLIADVADVVPRSQPLGQAQRRKQGRCRRLHRLRRQRQAGDFSPQLEQPER